MKKNPNTQVRFRLFKYICWLGYGLAFLGCLGVLLGVLHIFDMQIFSIGLSSGIRIIGSVGVSGCLLSAVGHTAIERYLI